MLSYNRATFSGVALKREDEVLVPLLEAIEGVESPPTHWGETIELRNPYDRLSVLNHSRGLYGTELGSLPCVQRTKPPRYTVSWTASINEGWSIDATLHPTTDPSSFEQFARLTKSITQAVAFDFAVVDYINDHTGESHLPGVGVHSGSLREYGITTAAPWTYFGPRIIAMVQEGAFTRLLGTGEGWLSLSPTPWFEVHSVLADRIRQVNEALDLLGLRVQRAPPGYAVRGKGWQPLMSPV